MDHVILQESTTPEEVACGVSSPTPTILWNRITAVLVVEQEIVTTVPQEEVPTALLAAYFVFNLSYPKGGSHCFSLLEILLLDRVPNNVHPKVSTLLSGLQGFE